MKRPKRGPLLVLFILLITPTLMGMGTSGTAVPPDKIPVPAKKFQVIFIDQLNVTTEASDVSIEGNTFIEGKKGEGTFTIAFEKIKSVIFLLKEGKLEALIGLRDGSTQQLAIAKNKMAFGKTAYGTYQISLGDLKKMSIVGHGK